MPKDLISVKLTKKEAEEAEVDFVPSAYPWGMKLTFDDEITDRFPALEKLDSEEKVAIVAEGYVSDVRVTDSGGNKTRTVEIQITGINMVSKESYDAAFDEATGKEKS